MPVLATPTPHQNQITINQNIYSYYYQPISKTDSFIVLPNFENPTDSDQLIQNNNCKYAINGGLYLENNRPLGLFVHNNKKYNHLSSSPTFNGFLFQDQNKPIDIGQTTSVSPAFVMQSGPLFDLNSSAPKYNQKVGRRHLITKDNQNNFYIFSIFTPESFLSGPTLNEIPLFFKDPSIQKIAKFTHILTLDGGSASVFHSPDKYIHETTFIGSLLCWK